jgi:hypothetical protein
VGDSLICNQLIKTKGVLRLKVAVIGAGGMGGQHIQIYKSMENVQ